ncbi:hypothetical protein BGY98DRAFT_107803 [Russula aff. rugulosa BPL654]|nr:hypothetical protein BGY98DRAFT_107803 [Russula aff. rugulosa BPL654]
MTRANAFAGDAVFQDDIKKESASKSGALGPRVQGQFVTVVQENEASRASRYARPTFPDLSIRALPLTCAHSRTRSCSWASRSIGRTDTVVTNASPLALPDPRAMLRTLPRPPVRTPLFPPHQMRNRQLWLNLSNPRNSTSIYYGRHKLL